MKWISVKDQLPPEPNEYLTVVENLSSKIKNRMVFYIDPHATFLFEGWKGINNPNHIMRITHWMEIPGLPD
ncbi:MAG: DUF551 domain-containing protein [Leptospira sp.]|nr:DUF551 domain-containing protein [Leptospira sp.]